MSRRIRAAVASVALASVALASAAFTAPLLAGPPWIGIELPANPLNPTTRGMYLLVRSYHHGGVVQYPVRGTATGLVDGQRRTVTLAFERTNIPGVMALRKTWSTQGSWVLAINVAGDEGPTALVGVGADGAVHSINVPTQSREGHTYGRKVTKQDIDAALRSVAAADADAPRELGAAGALLVIPVAAGLILARRRR